MHITMDEDELELNKETMEEIQKSREEYEKGKYYSLDEVKKRI